MVFLLSLCFVPWWLLLVFASDFSSDLLPSHVGQGRPRQASIASFSLRAKEMHRLFMLRYFLEEAGAQHIFVIDGRVMIFNRSFSAGVQ